MFEFVVQLSDVFFGFFADGDVVDECDDVVFFFAGIVGEAYFYGHVYAVFSEAEEVHACAHGPVLEVCVEVGPVVLVSLVEVTWHEYFYFPADEFFFGVAKFAEEEGVCE